MKKSVEICANCGKLGKEDSDSFVCPDCGCDVCVVLPIQMFHHLVKAGKAKE